jgi:hypothetical protein
VIGGGGAGNSVGGDNSDAGGTVGLAVGAALGAAAALAAIIAFFIVKKRRNAVAEELEEDADGEPTDLASTSTLGEDDAYVSEYGLSDHARQGASDGNEGVVPDENSGGQWSDAAPEE